jgi:octaprenyl-diphosphate synthase
LSTQPTSQNHIISTIAADMDAVNGVIRQRLHSEVALVNQIAEYIISAGGKRIRPVLVLLVANAYKYEGAAHHELAAVVEFIHTATLLHDDVVDESSLRRGRQTANALFGNAASVLVGDFLYSRAFQMMVSVGSMRVLEVLADATNVIAEGEVLQLLNANDADTTQERYFEVIYRKTAKLFESGAQIAAILAGAPTAIEGAMARYGRHLGTAFQLIDDVLDYNSDSEQLGKNLGDDLAEGKPTLPLIYALRVGNEEQRRVIRRSIEQGTAAELAAVTAAIESTGGLAYTARLARQEAALAVEALAELPESAYKQALRELADFAVERNY